MIRCFCLLCLALWLASTPTFASENCGTLGALPCDGYDVHALVDGYGGPEQQEDPLDAFRNFNNGWTSTASGSSGLGQPAVLTWSIVPDGTAMPGGLGEPRTPSNLVSFLDSIHHGGASPGGADLTGRDWFPLVDSSFGRWDELSGITFKYEPNDDGASLPANRGILGRRGDHRIGGHSIDGQTSPTFLAYNYFPNTSDTVIDTDEVDRWGNPEGNFLRFRNMLMHEIGHGLGINHVVSSDASILMEPILAVDLDGPQLDDILAVHRLYGDVHEAGGGNEMYLDATSLGRFWPGQSKTVGSDASDTVVDFTDVDFLSIDDDSDVDFFRFTVLAPSLIDLNLNPLGPTYQEGRQGGSQSPFDTSAQSDLSLTLWDGDGTTMLDVANDNGLGLGESMENLFLFDPGDYYLSVEGAQNAAQFYELSLDLSLPFPTRTDLFRNIVAEFARRAGFGRFFGDNSPLNLFHLPEPSTGLLMATCLGAFAVRRRRTLSSSKFSSDHAAPN